MDNSALRRIQGMLIWHKTLHLKPYSPGCRWAGDAGLWEGQNSWSDPKRQSLGALLVTFDPGHALGEARHVGFGNYVSLPSQQAFVYLLVAGNHLVDNEIVHKVLFCTTPHLLT
jgi:hypothetical protein